MVQDEQPQSVIRHLWDRRIDFFKKIQPGCQQQPNIPLVLSCNLSDTKSAVFMEVLNQDARTDHFPHNFTVCLSAMFDFNNVLQVPPCCFYCHFYYSAITQIPNEHSLIYHGVSTFQLVQSMEMLKVLGVSRVVVYKTSCSPQVQQLLDYYIQTGGV